MKKGYLKILANAKTMTAQQFADFLDKKDIPWIWDECDNILNYNEGRCVIDVIESGFNVWFEKGRFVEIYK